MRCDCAAWRANIDKVSGPIQLQSIRSGFQYQYDGAPFQYCPWCSSKLRDEPKCEHVGIVPSPDSWCPFCGERVPVRTSAVKP